MKDRFSGDLKRIRIATPCSARWEEMEGTDRERFCRLCSRHVYNFSALSPAEIQQLVQQREGRLCARFYQRADGTMLTADCPHALERLQRRLAVLVGSAVTMIGLSFSLMTSANSAETSGRPNRLKAETQEWTARV